MSLYCRWNLNRAYAFADVYPFTIPVLEYMLTESDWVTLASVRTFADYEISTPSWSVFVRMFGSPKSGCGVGFLESKLLNPKCSGGLKMFRIIPEKRKNVEEFIAACNHDC